MVVSLAKVGEYFPGVSGIATLDDLDCDSGSDWGHVNEKDYHGS